MSLLRTVTAVTTDDARNLAKSLLEKCLQSLLPGRADKSFQVDISLQSSKMLFLLAYWWLSAEQLSAARRSENNLAPTAIP